MSYIAVLLIVIVLVFLIGGMPATNGGFSLTRKRKQGDPSNKPSVLDVPCVFTIVATKLRCTFPIPMSANGLPGIYLTGGTHTGNELPTAVTYISPTVYDLTYPTSTIATNVATIPSKDPGFRGFNGAYAQAQVKTLA